MFKQDSEKPRKHGRARGGARGRIRWVACLVLLVCALGLAACQGTTGGGAGGGGGAGTGGAGQAGHRPVVVATIFAPFDFARQVAGANADVHMLLPPGSDSHSYEPTPADIRLIQTADIFIYVGGDSDTWVEGILASIDTSKMQVIRLIDCVPLLNEDESVAIESGDGLIGGLSATPELDEHVWTSPLNAKLIVQAINASLDEADPAEATAYDANATAYCAQLDELDAGFRDVIDHAQRRTLIFADRFPFRYLAAEYGLTCHAAYPGCSDAAEPSARTVAELIDLVRSNGAPVVFSTELSNGKMAQTICAETGATSMTLYSGHTVSRDDFAAGATYLSQMWENVATLKIALN
ncbi:MAG: metal ABC transporter substrate-binding protein [Coriobacteriia bacterium]|nr:metal ABC transporter substrate-binding protein [Coriobacteriia bacterium]